MSCCSACGKHACACGCGAVAGTPLPLYNRPGLDSLAYRVGTYADFRVTMQNDLSDAALPGLAGLRTRANDDPAMALLDAWAVGADVLSFYQERIANEGYLRTATERRSVLELARLVDYRLRPGVAASVYLAYTVEKDSPPVTIGAGARAQSIPAPGEQMQTFETAEPLDARYEWNALKPRLTKPQIVTRASLDSLTGLGFKGTANNLKTNDWLVFEFADGSTPAIRQIQQVTLDAVQQRTQVTLQPAVTDSIGALASAAPVSTFTSSATAAAPSAVGNAESPFVALVDALRQPSTVQPANARRLSRSTASALGNASDVRPQLLLNFEARLAGTFYAAWSGTPVRAGNAQVRNIYVQRLAAAKFGYNAPFRMKLVKDGDTYQSLPDTDWESVEKAGTLYLDNAYDGVRPGSYVIVSTPAVGATAASVEVHKVSSAAIHPRTAYGISGKTTELTLDNTPVASVSMVAMINNIHYITQTVRIQQVFAQSDPLQLAELLISDSVGSIAANDSSTRTSADSNTRLELAAAIDGLKAGRWVIVEGQRTDVPGTDAVSAAELVMLSAVEQGVDAQLPGDTVHSTLVFANQGLAYSYRRDSVTVHANVVRATHGETRHEVLGSGNGALSMQAFVLKQSPLTYVSAATIDGVQSTLGVRVNDMAWRETRNLAFVGAADRSFVTATDDSGKTSVVFGDGTDGARLPTGVENITAVYRNGIGTPGNVSAQQISLLATRPLGVKAVINPLRASGGADAETRDQARRNVPLAVLALDRLVSVPDYADFARTFGGVGKAAASKLGNLVQVTIAGAEDAPIDPTSDLYRNLLQALQQYGDPSLPLRLDVRELLALTLSAKVGLAPDYAWEVVEPQLRAALLDAFGFERRALAQNVYLSEIVACMQAVRGVVWVDVDALGSIDEATLLAGFGDSGDNGKGGDGASLMTHAATPATLPPRVQVLPARYDSDGRLLPAQLAYLPPNIPDTLLLQEATP
ncbi:putative baseplate assembly protein [Rhodanobacter glycinis]|uniref:Putative baseplate assembly protein n=1 Tax=Rhodanobacter glycinis TaxID=582702 RepID=A0A502CEE1_9GAMM|nr:putative baseplate assembly protein [Rhodanobacter glycinis]TPG11062.1 putative baseplate assembly protein [Rhodanobacter glycinis]TPG48550.1 putative baseplate assembly protein [Rhodanobacter glycinis]